MDHESGKARFSMPSLRFFGYPVGVIRVAYLNFPRVYFVEIAKIPRVFFEKTSDFLTNELSYQYFDERIGGEISGERSSNRY